MNLNESQIINLIQYVTAFACRVFAAPFRYLKRLYAHIELLLIENKAISYELKDNKKRADEYWDKAKAARMRARSL